MKLSFGVKIRFLLLLLGCCLIATSISLNIFTSKTELLERDAKEVQENLLTKEKEVYEFLANKKEVNEAKRYHVDPQKAIDYITNFRDGKGINLFTYKKGELKFWSTFKVSDIDPAAIKEGTSVLFFSNGWYEIIKSTQGDFELLFLMPIQSQYMVKENQYFKNYIDPFLSNSKILTFASFTDKDAYPIKSLDNRFLFGLKIKANYIDNYHSVTQLWLFIAGMLCFCMFANSVARLLARKGQIFWATTLLAAFFFIARFTDIEYGWFNHRFTLDLFDPKVYADNVMASLGDFLLNVLALTWLFMFMYNHKKQYKFPDWIKQNKIIGIVIHVVLLVFIGWVVLYADEVFFNLINHSKINFDIINILKLGGTSWVSIIILCLVWFIIYLITVISAVITTQLNVTNKERLIIFLIGFLLLFAYKLDHNFSAFFIVFALVFYIVLRSVYIRESQVSVGLFAIIFFCLAFNTSIKYIKYKDITERDLREQLARKQSSDDPNAIIALGNLEEQLLKDEFLVRYFAQDDKAKYILLKNHVKDYLDGYLTRYDYQIYAYNKMGFSIGGSAIQGIDKYKSLVESGSVKIDGASYFYQVNNTFGYQNYFGIVSVVDQGELLGTLIVELRSKTNNYNNRLPDLLGDQKLNHDTDYKGYSIAFYYNDKLLNQSGNYTYPLNGSVFKGDLTNVLIKNDIDRKVDYDHLVYMPSENKKVVISKQKVSYVERLAALSFFFLVFIIFSILLYGAIWLIKNLEDDKIGWFNINRSLMINASKILYKTRIQLSIVLSVVATLIIVGLVTYRYMNNEYLGQQQELIKDKIRKVQQNFEKQVFIHGIIANNENAIADFNSFADINNADLNLYDIHGTLLRTTYPKLFNNKIIGRKMGPLPYINLSMYQRSEFINPKETMGELTYAAAYAPIRDAQNEIIAYIGLPNYLNEVEYKDKIALFVSNLINIYALVFVAIGVLAVFLANQITSPLTFIQESISKTKIGQKNSPIVWRRHDEIGTLIREYNHMIAALEDSAIKLARSERESAWREMAKQVAHEIKNPLTPLKLGVQLLEKSWKEKDPNFEIKFNKFSKSFIEQIDSLSKIASEFSNFAKMPDTKLEKLAVLPIIDRAIEVFKSTDNVEIKIVNKADFDVKIMADSDQLLRTFNNLFKNAIEATDDNAQCSVMVVVYSDRENAYIEIKDNGKGIPQVLRDKIFVPNFTTKSSGTGLGLAFVKQATENAGGAISFTSILGVGTTFHLIFPLA